MSDTKRLDDIQKDVHKICTASGSGTGFTIKGFPYMITNHHVVQSFDAIALEGINKQRTLGHVRFVNPQKDIAFVDLGDMKKHNIIEHNPDVQVEAGQVVYTVGYPLGMPISVTKGIVSTQKQVVQGRSYIQTDAAINPGNSGGPLLTQEGQVIGVNTAIFAHAQNIGFAVSFEDVKKQMDIFLENQQGDNKKQFSCVHCDHCQAVEDFDGFCANCGSEMDVDRLKEKAEEDPIKNFVEETLVQLSYDPVLQRNGYHHWKIYKGSAPVHLYASHPSEKMQCLSVRAPMVKLPKKNLSAFYDDILSQKHPQFRFSINGVNELDLRYDIHISDLLSKHFESQLKDKIQELTELADSLDNHYTDTFECEPSAEAIV